MMILLALLLLVDLPRVETNVTVSGKKGKAGSLGFLAVSRQATMSLRHGVATRPDATMVPAGLDRKSTGSWEQDTLRRAAPR